MKKQNLSIIFIFIIGLGFLLYPVLSNIFINSSHATLIEEYDQAVQTFSAKEKEDMKKNAKSYNEKEVGESLQLTDPFGAEVTTETENSGYYELINVGEKMATIEIPTLNIEYPIYHGTSEEVLQKGIGHLSNSSLPVGGDSTHAILSGHRGLPSAEMFRYINQLKLGGKLFIHILDEVLAYEIYEIDVVLPHETSNLKIEKGRDLLTLVTCEPYMINTHRLLVKAERVPFTIEQAKEENIRQPLEKPNKFKIDIKELAIILAVLFFIIIFILLLLKKQKRRSR